MRKFSRNAASDTSAQVGRVATRLRVSAVVATFVIIAAVAGVSRLRPGYSRFPALFVFRNNSPARAALYHFSF
jgi:hypothetical protein